LAARQVTDLPTSIVVLDCEMVQDGGTGAEGARGAAARSGPSPAKINPADKSIPNGMSLLRIVID